MTSLRIIEGVEKKEWKDPRPDMIVMFNEAYLKATGNKNPFTFGACMRAMLTFEQADPKTGELLIDYPEQEAWTREIEGFFKDEFARDKRNYHFTYFLKQFGSFGRSKKVQRKNYWCGNCLANHPEGEHTR